MKKTFALLIACLYLAVSSGLAVQIHHCMGKVSGMSLLMKTKNTCDKCGMEKGANKCCKDELKFVKLQDSYKLTNASFNISIAVTNLLGNEQRGIGPLSLLERSSLGYGSHSPPDFPEIPLNILHCNFRI